LTVSSRLANDADAIAQVLDFGQLVDEMKTVRPSLYSRTALRTQLDERIRPAGLVEDEQFAGSWAATWPTFCLCRATGPVFLLDRAQALDQRSR
jgi:hypothetical protein